MNLSPYAIHADYYTGIYAGMYTDAMTGRRRRTARARRGGHGAVELPHPDTLTPAAAECGGRIPPEDWLLPRTMPGCGLQTRPGTPARGRRTVLIRRGITNPCAVAFLLWNICYFCP